MIIAGTFLAALVVFAVFWAVRAAQGKVSFAPPRAEDLPAGSAADADPIYAAPATLPPPLPAEPSTAPFARWLKVPVSPYRLIDLPLIAIVLFIYAGLTLGGGGDHGPDEPKFTPTLLVASMIFQLLFMGMVVAFVSWRVRLAEWLGLRWKQWYLAFAIAPLAVFFMWCFMGTLHVSGWNAWLEKSLGIESMQEAVKLLQQAQDPLVITLMGVAAVIVAPLAEEIVFRGYLYPVAKRFCGPAGGILFSSLVFAAAHGNVVALLPLFVLAVLLCLIYEFTGSIWASISVHFLFNAATVAIQLLARSGLVEMPAE